LADLVLWARVIACWPRLPMGPRCVDAILRALVASPAGVAARQPHVPRPAWST